MEPVAVASIPAGHAGAPHPVVGVPATSLRRAPTAPAPFPGEIVRRLALDALGRRFDVAVTSVVAGAGFGKTTALAQAVRANLAGPRGNDAWVSCEPGDGHAGRLAAAIVSALGSELGTARDPLDAVLSALSQHAPVDVCVIVDDVHEVAPESSGADLLAGLVRRMPPHAHLVLAGRTPPPVPLARLRAAGQVVDLDETLLVFSEAEVDCLARALGRDLEVAGAHAGWPSLVRLALSTPQAMSEFLWEEVVSQLAPTRREQLLALAVLGWGTASDVAEVIGRGPVDLDALVAAVPLIARDGHGRYRAHQLWEDAAGDVFDASELGTARERALRLFERRGETPRLGWRALQWQHADAVVTAARLLVRDSFGALPIDTARRWIAEAPGPARARADLRLLAVALRQAIDHDDAGLDAEIDAVVAEFVEAHDRGGTGVALALGAVAAHERGDELRLFEIDQRARSLDVTGEPVLEFLAEAMVAGIAALQGDVDRALAALARIRFDRVPPTVTELVVRLHVAMLCLAGRADEAIDVAEALKGSPSAWVRGHQGHARWQAGDPSPYAGRPLDVEPGPDLNARYRLFHALHFSAVAASLGDQAALAALRPTVEAAARSATGGRDRTMVALATALARISDHDDAGACRIVAAHVDRCGDDRLAAAHLRKLPAVVYLCDERVREPWRRGPLGPAHRRQLDVADDLLAARAGTLSVDAELAPPGQVLTSLPLAWSVELAARATATGVRAARALAVGLADLAPTAVRAELLRAAATGDAELAAGAAALLDLVPDPDRAQVEVRVLGPLAVLVDGEPVAGDDISRRRVRGVLAVLAVTGPLRRERLVDLLWPDLDPVAAGRNMRVTLTRVRSALGVRDALRTDGDLVGLAPHVDVDLRRFEADLDAAAAAEGAGDPLGLVAALERACALWRGEPLTDADAIAGVAVDVEHVRRLVTDTALRLGELHFVSGRCDLAVTWAERVRSASPYDERAHRLAVAAHLQRGDRLAAARAVAATRTMLAELAADPEPATEMLLRQADARVGNVVLTPAP